MTADGKLPAAEGNRGWLELTDEALLANCRFDAFRGSGPGGQKRNKTSNCIRLTHLPTGIHVMAGESRSTVENTGRAVRRLKLKLATELRLPIDVHGFAPPAWFASVTMLGRLSVSPHNALYARTAALLLDLMEARNGSIGDAAKLLGVSTTSVVAFLEREHSLWQAANQIRKKVGKEALSRRK